MSALKKKFLSRLDLILQFEVFFNQLYFFFVAHAYRKLIHTLESLFLEKSNTPLTLSADAYISSGACIKTHYTTSTYLQKTNTRQNNMAKITFFMASALVLAILVAISQAQRAGMICTLSTRQYLIGRYYFSA